MSNSERQKPTFDVNAMLVPRNSFLRQRLAVDFPNLNQSLSRVISQIEGDGSVLGCILTGSLVDMLSDPKFQNEFRYWGKESPESDVDLIVVADRNIVTSAVSQSFIQSEHAHLFNTGEIDMFSSKKALDGTLLSLKVLARDQWLKLTQLEHTMLRTKRDTSLISKKEWTTFPTLGGNSILYLYQEIQCGHDSYEISWDSLSQMFPDEVIVTDLHAMLLKGICLNENSEITDAQNSLRKKLKHGYENKNNLHL